MTMMLVIQVLAGLSLISLTLVLASAFAVLAGDKWILKSSMGLPAAFRVSFYGWLSSLLANIFLIFLMVIFGAVVKLFQIELFGEVILGVLLFSLLWVNLGLFLIHGVLIRDAYGREFSTALLAAVAPALIYGAFFDLIWLMISLMLWAQND